MIPKTTKHQIIDLALLDIAKELCYFAYPNKPVSSFTENSTVYLFNLKSNLPQKIDVKEILNIVEASSSLENLIDTLNKLVVLSPKDESYISDFKPEKKEYEDIYLASFLVKKYLAKEMQKLDLTEAEAKKLLTAKSAKIIEPRLYEQGNLEPTPSCAIVDTVYSFCIGRNLPLKRDQADLVGRKQFTNGSVELVLEKIKKETEEAIINAYGVDTLDIFYVLIAYSFKNQLSYNQSITVSGWDILDYINRRNKRNSTGEKRLTKKQGLDWVAHHCKLLDGLKVFVGKWSNPGKKEFMVSETPLIIFEEIAPTYQVDSYGLVDKTKLIDYHVTFRPGKWLEYFGDSTGTYLKQFGYSHKEVLSLTSRTNLGKNIGHWLMFKLEQNSSGKFKIRTVLEQVGERTRLESILSDRDSKQAGGLARNLKRDWDFAIEQLTTINDPYGFSYVNPPAWVSGDAKKPKGWFMLWLDLRVVFTKPACLSSRSYREIETEKPKPNTEKLSYVDVVEALNQHKDNTNVSIRKLATWYGVSVGWLQRRLKGKPKFKAHEIKDLLKAIELLAKEK